MTTNAISELRQQLATDLGGADLKVTNGWPSQPVLPAVIVVPEQAADYITYGPGFTDFTLHMNVFCVAKHYQDTNRAMDWLDETLVTVLGNVQDWDDLRVTSPATITLGGTEYLATIVQLSHSIKIA